MSSERVRVIHTGENTRLPPLPEGADRRTSLRRTVKIPGLIATAGTASHVACTVVDQSFGGARILIQAKSGNPFTSSSSIGKRFTLAMRLDRVELDCEIVWVDIDQLGVKFISLARTIKRRH
jgi:hypothetical protein